LLGRRLQAAFEHVADTEVAPDPPDVHRLVRVDGGRVAGDDEEIAKLRQVGDDVFGDAGGKALPRGLSEILERKYGD
jgi:hypothetical protein